MNDSDDDTPFEEEVEQHVQIEQQPNLEPPAVAVNVEPPAVAVNLEPPAVAVNLEAPALAVSFPSAALLTETNRLQSKCISSHPDWSSSSLITPISSLPSCQFPVSSKQLQDESSYPV